MKHILVVGGAGYIGSHMCTYLKKQGCRPIVLDTLITGHREAVKDFPLYEGSAADENILHRIFSAHPIEAVMHFAAHCYVAESITDPAQYYRNNVSITLSLLESMLQHGISKFIFSSSCAVYGEPIHIPIDESHPRAPISPYGKTKFMVEEILADFQTAYDFEYISLRYFNAAGTDTEGKIGEDHRPETHLIPIVLETCLDKRDGVSIFGDDYPTQDGTCIRDYIHVNDLAHAHYLALNHLFNGLGSDVFNLGSGKGYSVKEIIETVQSVTGREVSTRVVERRSGDPAVLIASNDKLSTKLGWHPRFSDIRTIIETAWQWHKHHPNGYTQ